MSLKRTVAIMSIAAIAIAACGSGTTTTAPPASVAAKTPAASSACKVGVAWATFQEQRYGLRDEPGIRAALAAGGAEYIGNSAINKADIQAANVASLIAAGVDVLVLNAVDPQAILPSLQDALDAGIPVIAYDRELESSKVLFMTHNNVLVGHMIADEVTKVQPTGNYAIILGDKTQTNPVFLRTGMQEILKPFLDSHAITIVAEQNTDSWQADLAQTEMEQILTANSDNIQAVLSENDNMATGVVAALHGNTDGAVKIGGQDGDTFALNRVALGTQVVSVWKDATALGKAAGEAALQLCKNPDITKVTGAVPSKTTGGLATSALLLAPVAITKDNLQVVLDANWITSAELCKDVPTGTVSVCP